MVQVFNREAGVDLGAAKDGDKKKKALNKLRNAAAQIKVYRANNRCKFMRALFLRLRASDQLDLPDDEVTGLRRMME